MDTDDARASAERGQLSLKLELISVLSRFVGMLALLFWVGDRQLLLHRSPADAPRQSLTLAVVAIGFTISWSTEAFAKPLPETSRRRMAARAERWVSLLCAIWAVIALLSMSTNPG